MTVLQEINYLLGLILEELEKPTQQEEQEYK